MVKGVVRGCVNMVKGARVACVDMSSMCRHGYRSRSRVDRETERQRDRETESARCAERQRTQAHEIYPYANRLVASKFVSVHAHYTL